MKLTLIASMALMLSACGGAASLPDPKATPLPTVPAEFMRPAQPLKTLEPHER